MKDSLAKIVTKRRLRPFHLALCVLFVGWTPSLLLAYYSYTVLRGALESKSLDDAETLIDSLSQHVTNELVRSGDTLEYYRTLPSTAALFAPTPAPVAAAVPTPTPSEWAVNARRRPTPRAPATTLPTPAPVAAVTPTATPPTPAEWLENIFYPRSRTIDGLFLADATGHALAVLPPPVKGGADKSMEFSAAPWKDLPEPPENGFRVSPAYRRAADGRTVVSIVATIRDKAGAGILGYLGADLLVERIGRRLHSVETPGNSLQIIDQNGHPFFAGAFQANALDHGEAAPELRRDFSKQKTGMDELHDRMYFYAPVHPTGWTALLERPAAAFHKPVHDFLRQTALLVGLLVVGTVVAAIFLTTFYRRQLLSSLRVERAQIFNEKILANMPVGIALVDPEGERILHANESFTEIAASLGGLPRGTDITQTRFSQVNVANREALARVLGFGVPFQSVEQRTPGANGQTRYLTTNLLRLQDSSQRTLGVLCLVEDSTPAVTLRQELINANTSKDQFLAQLSHELRNPLSPVLTMVAELETVTDVLPAARLPLEIIRRNVELEARLIDDLLDVTRISRGKLQLSLQTVDVHRTMRLALEICQREIDEKELKVELELRAKLHHVRADPARLQQIFWNLLKNAVKFTPQGKRIVVRSINLAAATRPRNVQASSVDFMRGAGGVSGSTAPGLAVRQENGHAIKAPGEEPDADFVRVEVIDEGIGVEPQHLRRIFNAFDQGQSSITQRFGGLGLGLAISKAMVDAHGGHLTVASEGTGKGATFNVELATVMPPTPEETAAANPTIPAATGAPKPTDGAGRSVLLVDDHLDTCLGMSRLLKRRGYKVAVAHSVTEALATAEGDKFDLLISDIGLPDGTGFDLMSTLRERGGPPGIALSGYGMENDIEKSREAGFSEHLIKPVTIDRLDDAIRRLFASGA